MPGSNVDPLNPANAPTSAALLGAGLRWVRLVSRDNNAVRGAAADYQAAGIMVLAIITEQSGGYVLPGADYCQIGNEPDVSGTADAMSAHDYVAYWNLYYDTWFAPGRPYASVPVIGAGLGSGDTNYWRQVQNAGGLRGAAGYAVHPYAKTAGQALSLLTAYRAVTPTMSCWVTEWARPTREIAEFRAMLERVPGLVSHAYFSWGGQDDVQFNLTDSQRRILGAV